MRLRFKFYISKIWYLNLGLPLHSSMENAPDYSGVCEWFSGFFMKNFGQFWLHSHGKTDNPFEIMKTFVDRKIIFCPTLFSIIYLP